MSETFPGARPSMMPEACRSSAPPSVDDARQSLNASAADAGARIYERYGPRIGWAQLLRLLLDRECVRYPCDIAFDPAHLQPGEFAYPAPKGDHPQDGFTIYVHPYFEPQLEQVPLLVLYQLVLVNYGRFAAAEDAEAFGAAALGLDRETYYQAVCRLADELAASVSPA